MGRTWVRTIAILVWIALLSVGAAAVTADEILDAMDLEEDRTSEGGLLVTVRVDNEYADGATSGYVLYGLSKPGKQLMYFAEPELEEGITYLFVEEKIDGLTKTRFWLYLPVFGIIKELVSEEELGGGFAGSSLSLSDMGGDDAREDYDVVLLREETLTIGDTARTAYVLEMTGKPGADVEDDRVLMWVDAELYVMLKTESYNEFGSLSSRTDVLELGDFEGRLVMTAIVSADGFGEHRSTFTFTSRRRPAEGIPDEVFTPDGVETFDPDEWGF